MPALLNYAIVTDPTSLPASQPGMPSVGRVYVVVSNPHLQPVTWNSIEVEVSGDLTSRPQDVSTSAEIDPPTPQVALDFRWDSSKRVFRVFVPPRLALTMSPGDSIVLKMENIVVSDTERLALLKIHEVAWGGDDRRAQPSGGDFYSVTHALVKSAPKVPRNFRPDKSMVDVDAREDVVLRWDGPDNLAYWIQYPGGKVRVPQPPGPRVTQRSYEWKVSPAPKRGTTYTLVAGTDNPVQEGYFLTTTVHARIPEFESGTRTPWVEGTPNKGRVTFSAEGVEIRNQTGRWGTVAADKADVHGVNTKWVQGRTADDGWIDFPKSGVRVFRDGQNELGTLKAEKADLDDLLTVEARVKGQLVVDGGMKVSHEGEQIFETYFDRVLFYVLGEFKKSILVYGGGIISYEHGGLWVGEPHGGVIVSCDLRVQEGGRISVSSGNPTQVRYL